MGTIVNPRGTNGAGKTRLVRFILGDMQASGRRLEPIWRKDRAWPMGYRMLASDGPIVVLGHYERTSGGCDTVTLRDGGIDEIVRLADKHAAGGARVLLEGATLSEEHASSAELARRHRLCVLCLDTPLEACVRNLIARRRVGRNSWSAIMATVETRRDKVANVCARLERDGAMVMHLSFEAALARARLLLGVVPREQRPTLVAGSHALTAPACRILDPPSRAPPLSTT